MEVFIKTIVKICFLNMNHKNTPFLQNFYDIASPHFEILEEHIDDYGYLVKYAGIRLDILMNLEINE